MEETRFTIECYCIDFDGERPFLTLKQLQIEFFDGERSFTSLPFYLLRFLPDSRRLPEQREEKGRRFQSFVTKK